MQGKQIRAASPSQLLQSQSHLLQSQSRQSKPVSSQQKTPTRTENTIPKITQEKTMAMIAPTESPLDPVGIAEIEGLDDVGAGGM